MIRAATIRTSGSLASRPKARRSDDICNRAIGSSAVGAFGPLAMLTPFCGGGAVPSDTEPASTGKLKPNPTARLAIAESLPKGSFARGAMINFQPESRRSVNLSYLVQW
jgi:hypothetical protein